MEEVWKWICGYCVIVAVQLELKHCVECVIEFVESSLNASSHDCVFESMKA